jgi:hypothetical protein
VIRVISRASARGSTGAILHLVPDYDDNKRLYEAIDSYVRAVAGSIIVVAPALAMFALGAPLWATTGFLILVIIVLTPVVLRRRRRRR